MDLLIATLAGLEDVAAAEVEREIGLEPRIVAPGRLAIAVKDGDGRAIAVRLNANLRCVERVGIVLATLPGTELGAIEEAVRRVDLATHVAPTRSFAVRGRRRLAQKYGSLDLAGAVGEAVIDRLRAQSGVRAPVDLDDPDAILRAEVGGDGFLLWLDTSGDTALSQRAYRRYAHMASLRPTTANLLLRLSGWSDEVLVDPFCGSATILIEAAHEALATSPAALRDIDWAWQRLPAFDHLAPPHPRAVPRLRRAALRLVGIERFASHLHGALQNIVSAGLRDVVRLHGGLAERADTLLPSRDRDSAPRIVVTNPPFGRRVSSPRHVAALYGRAAAAWARAGVERVVTWSELDEAMGEALEGAGFVLANRRPVIYGSSPVTLFVAEQRAASAA